MSKSFAWALSGVLSVFVGLNSALATPIFLNIEGGLPLLNAAVNDGTVKPVGAAFVVAAEVIKPLEGTPIAIGVYYQGFFSSPYGFIPLNNNGINIYYYPFGVANASKSIDGDVSVSIWRPALFVKTGIGLSFFNFRGGDATGIVFGASAVNYELGGGFDYPITRSMSLGIEADYMSTFGGESVNPVNPVGATGFLFLTRLSFSVD